MTSVIEDIQKIISWYSENYAGASIENLMDAKSKLLVLCARFAEEVADSKRQSVMATVIRKADHHNYKSRLVDEGFTQGLAESKSVASVVAQMKYEAESEALSFKSKLLLELARDIAGDLGQRISYLKIERNA